MSVPTVNRPAMEVVPTSHGLLVAMGRFAAQIGLLDALQRVPVKMKTIDHTPGDKLAELLAHTLAGGMHLKELETSPRPLVRDAAVAQAWGQAAFASASGVSDLLRAATPATVEAFRAAVREVAAPYRRRVLRDLTPAWLVVDFDLTGLVVSDQAATYEGADYGYMGEVGGVAKGYQFARAQVAGRHEALLLGGFLHPGRTVSGACLAELVGLVEAELGRPRRRFACRQWRGEGQPERWSALLVTPELAAREWPARRVGTFYNQRQVAEATIKEGKTVLAS